MVTVTFQGTTVADVRAQMTSMLMGEPVVHSNSLPYEIKINVPVHKDAEPVHKPVGQEGYDLAASIVEDDEKPVVKRTRRTKAEIEAEKAAKAPARDPEETFETKQHDTRAEEPAVVVEAPAKTASKETVHQALQQVNVAVGLNKAREILAAFKIGRISELKEDQYKPFVEKCNEAVMLEG